MKYYGTDFSENHKELNRLLSAKDKIEEAKSLYLILHGQLHESRVYGSESNEFDALIQGLTQKMAAVMPTKKDVTILWSLWHITRIEDAVMNLLIAGEQQVFDRTWAERLKTDVTDTGNAMNDEEILSLSKEVPLNELLAYRAAVGERTREIVSALTQNDLKRKPSVREGERLLSEGVLLPCEDSVWLKDFWMGKTISGLLLMPGSREPLLHLNDCARLKTVIYNNKI